MPGIPRTAGAYDVAKRLWQQFRATWGQIASRISFWTVMAATVCLSSIYYFVFAESLVQLLHDHQRSEQIRLLSLCAGWIARISRRIKSG